MNTLVVTGTRNGRDDVREALDAYIATFGRPYIILGGDKNGELYTQRGVDKQAGSYAFMNRLHGVICYADWDNGPSAGPERNRLMISKCRRGHHLLAFPDGQSKGTWDCFRKGEEAGLYCVEVTSGWLKRLVDMIPERKAKEQKALESL